MELKDPLPKWEESGSTQITPAQEEIIRYTEAHPWVTQEEVAEATGSAQSHVGRVLRQQGQQFVDTINELSRHTQSMMNPISLPDPLFTDANDSATISDDATTSESAGQIEESTPDIPDDTEQLTFDRMDNHGS